MSTVSYRGIRIEPAPFVSINKTYQRTDGGNPIGSLFNITLYGTLMSYMGTPDSDGSTYTGTGFYPSGQGQPAVFDVEDDARLSSLLRKQEAIRSIFSIDGGMFEIQGDDGSQPCKANVRINNINFEQGQWFTLSKYTVEMECDVLSVNGQLVGEDSFIDYISSAQETWDFQTNEQAENENIPHTFLMNHSITAKGKRYYDDTGTLIYEAWEQAKNYVNKRIGLSNAPSPSALLTLPINYRAFNHLRSENIDIFGGNYGITESWLLASGVASEDFTISTNVAREDGLVNVSIQGNIQGFEERNTELLLISTKSQNAETKFTQVSGVSITRAQSYSGYNLNVIPQSFSIAKNPIAGTINYTYEYNNRPSNLITGSRSEVISLNDSFGIDVFANIPVLGRFAGPVLQDIGTHQAQTRNLNIELVMNSPGPSANLSDLINNNPLNNPVPSSQIQSIINTVLPVANQVFISQQNSNWDLIGQRFSYNVEWTYSN